MPRYNRNDTKNLLLRGKTWYVRAKIAGVLIYQTLRTDSLMVAQQRRDEILNERLAQRDEKSLLKSIRRQLAGIEAEEKERQNAPDTGILLMDALDKFEKDPTRRPCQQRTLDNNKANWILFLRWMAKNHPEIQFCRQVTRAVCMEWSGEMLRSVAATNTYNHYISSVRYVMETICKLDEAFHNPMSTIHKRRDDDCAVKRPFSATELKLIFSSQDEEFKRLCAIGLYTTLRFDNARTLRWDAFDESLAHLEARHTKTRTDATLECPPELIYWLQRVPKDQRVGFVCPIFSGSRTKSMLLFMSRLRGVGIQTHAETPGLNGRLRNVCLKGFHSFRHTAVTLAQANGATPAQISRLAWGTGGKATTLDRYSHLSEVDAGKASALIGRFW